MIQFQGWPMRKNSAYNCNIYIQYIRAKREVQERAIIRKIRKIKQESARYTQERQYLVQYAQITGFQALVNCARSTKFKKTVIFSEKGLDGGDIFCYALATITKANAKPRLSKSPQSRPRLFKVVGYETMLNSKLVIRISKL